MASIKHRASHVMDWLRNPGLFCNARESDHASRAALPQRTPCLLLKTSSGCKNNNFVFHPSSPSDLVTQPRRDKSAQVVLGELWVNCAGSALAWSHRTLEVHVYRTGSDTLLKR